MSSDIILGAMVLVPVALMTFFRINAAIVFLSLCLGSVLVQFVSPDANQFLTLFSAHVPKGIDTGDNSIKILLLLLPVILTAIFMVRTIHGHAKKILNLLPALGTGLLASLLLTPLLPGNFSGDILDSNLWQQLIKAQDLIVGSSALVCLLVLWLQRPKTGGRKEKHEKS